MYADRYHRRGLNPGALALAGGASFFLLFGLSLSAPNFIDTPEKKFEVVNHPVEPPPPPKPVEPTPQPQPKEARPIDAARPDPVEVSKPVVVTAAGAETAPAVDLPPNRSDVVGTGTGIVEKVPVHIPVFFGPEIDSRYAESFQPAYPAGERSAEREGRVVVKVLIGADGRVKAVEPVTAASPAFFEATKRQALGKWRFKPATRDGVAVEAWRTMAVRFELDAE